MKSFAILGLALLFVTACSSSETTDHVDAASTDAASTDAAVMDAGLTDSAVMDAAIALECTESVSLDGSDNTPTAVDLTALDSEGATICLALDSRENVVSAHFAADTGFDMGPTSPFEMALFDEDGVLLREGWDLTVGQSDPQTRSHLEHSFPIGGVAHVTLRIRLQEATTSDATELSLSLFEPYE